ncbi:mycofactocin-coupled SDR family oxidoreductase [Gordonia rubripertincta]|uniref:Mycofactocin-coupled SDR family oxidoreductase n=1 Tax=Gordonia rubripertincta TaxID=36822 RepID=A0ABT4MP24_GORRU|nr:mycofactocin-coupled SDR family oxidoreductase [Gordonia rubripertincta]MCZ4548589.1 mycofactocin-coupled SDR family oxidoreductase [Gordonia rubripertincta]
MNSLEGKVAFITGAARGQGRCHAIELARRGASIYGVDICAQIETVPYAMGTSEDLAQTVTEVEAVGGKIATEIVDVRDRKAMDEAARSCASTFGVPDIVLANAGISPQRAEEPDAQAVFIDTITTNLTGVWNTVSAIAPAMIDRAEGGAVVITSSAQGLIGRGGDGSGGATGYTASKHGVVGLMHSFAAWLAPHSIRVNTIHPTGVRTPMVLHAEMAGWLEANPEIAATMGNPMPIEMVDPIDVTRAVLYLVEESGRFVTGITLPVDAGFTTK